MLSSAQLQCAIQWNSSIAKHNIHAQKPRAQPNSSNIDNIEDQQLIKKLNADCYSEESTYFTKQSLLNASAYCLCPLLTAHCSPLIASILQNFAHLAHFYSLCKFSADVFSFFSCSKLSWGMQYPYTCPTCWMIATWFVSLDLYHLICITLDSDIDIQYCDRRFYQNEKFSAISKLALGPWLVNTTVYKGRTYRHIFVKKRPYLI